MIRKTIRLYEVGKDPNPKESCKVGVISKFGTILSVNYSKKYDAFNSEDYETKEDSERNRLTSVKYWFRLPKDLEE